MARTRATGLTLTKPRIYLGRMLIFIAVVAAVAGALHRPLMDAFMANPALNGLIAGVLLIGLLFMLRQPFVLFREIDWLNAYRRADPGLSPKDIGRAPPVLLAPMAMMLAEHRGAIRLSASATRSILDSVGSRLDESRDIARYLIGLLVFLGLLGTFWGLLQTIGSLGTTISALSPGGGTNETFEQLRAGLEGPLGGMGTAFSSSLLGLSGSLVLGFLDLQGAQAQNRFYNELEEWLSTVTRLAAPGGDGDEPDRGGQASPAYLAALMEQTSEGLAALERTLARMEDRAATAGDPVGRVADRLDALTEQMRAQAGLMLRIAESSVELRPAMERIARTLEAGGSEAGLAHLRSLDVTAKRLLEQAAEGRAQTLAELRAEMKILARALAQSRGQD